MKIGITGAEGFIGSYLRLRLACSGAEVANCPRPAWDNPALLADWVHDLDAIVHLAGLSRHADGEYLYRVNVNLTQKLIDALLVADSHAHVYFGSTTHEAKTLPYHASKRESRRLLEEWSHSTGNRATTLLMANTFGPGGKPFFNSVISTFCYLAAHGKSPEEIDADAELALIFISDLVRQIDALVCADSAPTGAVTLGAAYHPQLVDVWGLLQKFHAVPAGTVPALSDCFTADLWSTFQSYRP